MEGEILNAKFLRSLTFLLLAEAALLPSSSANDRGGSSFGEVSLIEFVMTYKPMDSCTQQRLFARVKLENKAPDAIDFPAFDIDRKKVLRLGTEANIEFIVPGDRDWRLMAGAGGQGPDSQWTVPSKASGMVYLDWPVGLFVNYPSETQFRITLIDSRSRLYRSEPFRLHEGKYLLRSEYLAEEKEVEVERKSKDMHFSRRRE